MKDNNFKIVARDTLNWAKMPIDAQMDNPKSKWNSVVAYREYLPDALMLLESTKNTQTILCLYNDSLEVFTQQNQWIFKDDVYTLEKQAREWTVLKNNSFYICHQSRDRVIVKLYEFFIKSNVIDGLSIEDSLKSQYQ